ncbi:MAG: phosphate signaling complex protein PhoU [Candidatus Aminicenantes bacterium]|jgi:phosphate transport system protein|nr:phosphate signaling complex protein PhoU [Candidatus Aminicenantes bacterium]
MVREAFQEDMKKLEQQLVAMGEMVTKAVNRSVAALISRNVEQAKQIMRDDLLINRKRWDIEEECINLIATQQPVATDLREIIALLNIITDLERMGDHAEGIAKIVILLGDEPLVRPLIDIPRMAEKTTDMIKRSLEAFVKRDAKIARAICNEDDEVDRLYDQVYGELLAFMIEDPTAITRATYLIWTAHNLERIADRVTNICERIVFLVTGTMEEISVSKY